jgi:hypothetical protein
MNEEQQQFFDAVLAYYTLVHAMGQDPQHIASNTKKLGLEAALQNAHIARRREVVLLKKGRRKTKPIEKVRPRDVPFMMAQLEADNQCSELVERWQSLKRTWHA